jgi:hypothetical protein
MVDRVKPLKIEGTDTGGTQNDLFPTSVNPNEDYLECSGLVLDDASNTDESTIIRRNGNNMEFKDTSNSTFVTLSDLIAGSGGLTEDAHKVLRQLIHFIDDGPAEGFTSGAYKETLPSGSVFPTSEIWWESSSKLKKIVSLATTWTGVNPTQEIWDIYDTDGSTSLATITDSISYTGVFETSRTRTIVVH